MKPKNRRDLSRGFSLLEVMIASTVFAITAMGLVALNKVAMNASVYGRDRTAAANLAQFAMTWLENEVSSYASVDVAAADLSAEVNNPFFTKLKQTVAQATPVTNWVPLTGDGASGNVRFDEYLSNQTDTKYSLGDSARFCMHYRLLITNGPDSIKVLPGNLYHASVLVTWPKVGGFTTEDDGDWTDCTDRLGSLSAADGDVPDNYNQFLLEQILTRDFSNKIEKPE